MSDRMHTRRRFVASLSAALGALAAGGGVHGALASPRREQGTHPTPRPDVDASKVLTRDRLGKDDDLAKVFDMVREMPQIVDGIRCQCGCADVPGYYSLLSCFEGEAMARHCELCQGQARLAHRLYRAGRTLDQIRAAIDAEFG
jgi:hypothetical protein